jgi:hypothetical protein
VLKTWRIFWMIFPLSSGWLELVSICTGKRGAKKGIHKKTIRKFGLYKLKQRLP